MAQQLSCIALNKDQYVCDPTNYPQTLHDDYNSLILLNDIRLPEREAGLVNDLADDLFPATHKPSLLLIGAKHNSFRAYNSKDHFNQVYVHLPTHVSYAESACVLQNISALQMTNVSIASPLLDISTFDKEGNLKTISLVNSQTIIILSDLTQESLAHNTILWQSITRHLPTVLADSDLKLLDNVYPFKYNLTNSTRCLYLNPALERTFRQHFSYYLEHDGVTLQYDNLIHLCIMVKNGGYIFEKMLLGNLHLIDRWTILDTGSTDNTIDIINKVLVGKKKGKLYQEPFINFRESRNRCLDLAGQSCKFNLMLDDTYIVQGDLRSFLTLVRGDQFADSFSIIVQSKDTEYYSNRVTKSKNKLRYIYTIHEVIQQNDNTNVGIPRDVAYILDECADYMQERTMARKQYDLDCLFEMVREYPDDPRHLYYIAQTYNLLKQYDKACEYFYKRAFHPAKGFDQERNDALFELTRNYNYNLKPPRSWEECEMYYKMLYEWDKERPEGPYFIAMHYYLNNQLEEAYKWFKLTFEIGYPLHRQYSLKPTLSFHFCPRFLTELAFCFKDYGLAKKASELYLQHNKPSSSGYQIVQGFHRLVCSVLTMPTVVPLPYMPQNPVFAFVADGGFKPWSGSSIDKEGVGSSETYIIELATQVQALTNFEVVVFCRCEQEEMYKGVKYAKIERFSEVAATVQITYCVISRYSEYIPIAIDGHVVNIYVVLHDLDLTVNVIPQHPKIKNFFCLSQWHRDLWASNYPQFDAITKPFHYGIDTDRFNQPTASKVPGRFIYSSFANRGLKTLLEMWPKIAKRFPYVSLHIFCDFNNHWLLQHYAAEVQDIKALLVDYEQRGYNITNFGWVNKQRLADAWAEADVWLYPCKFAETFCLTALEAAITKTLVITNDLAGLKDTVGDRGVVISGDTTTPEWQQKALYELCKYLETPSSHEYLKLIRRNYDWACTHSWQDRAKDLIENYVLYEPINVYLSKKIDKMFRYNPTVVNVPQLGRLMTYNEDDLISRELIQGRCWEYELFELVDKYINHLSVVFDVGAFIGTHTLALARKVKHVIACEPYHASFNLLSTNILLNNLQNVTCINKGLSNKEEVRNEMWIPIQLINHGCARFDEAFKSINTSVPGKYELTTLDYLVDQVKATNIDLIKMDTEGYEDKVIEGGKQTLMTFKPAILIENTSNQQPYKCLLDLGYQQVHKIDAKFHSNSIYVHTSKLSSCKQSLPNTSVLGSKSNSNSYKEPLTTASNLYLST